MFISVGGRGDETCVFLRVKLHDRSTAPAAPPLFVQSSWFPCPELDVIVSESSGLQAPPIKQGTLNITGGVPGTQASLNWFYEERHTFHGSAGSQSAPRNWENRASELLKTV